METFPRPWPEHMSPQTRSEQVVLLATGESRRLRPLTETMPSPMVPLANRPVMAYTVELLARQRFKRMVVCLYYLAGHVEAFFGHGQRWGVAFDYVLQRDAWGSAGSLRWAKQLLDGTFAVMPADTIVDLDLAEAIRHHRAHQMPATVIVHASNCEGAGALTLGEDGLVTGLAQGLNGKPSWYNTGVYIFEPQVLDLIPARTEVDIHNQLLPAILDAGLPINTYRINGYWNTLDTFKSYYEAQSVMLQSYLDGPPEGNGKALMQHLSLDGRQVAQGIWIGHNTVVHPTTRFAQPVYIGDNCLIGRDAELGPDVVIGQNVIVDEEATISHSTILDNTYVGQLVMADHRLVNKGLVVDINTAEHVQIVDEFLLGSTHQNVAFGGLARFVQILFASLLLLLTLPLTLPLALLSLLATGHVFQFLPRAHARPTTTGLARPVATDVFNLIRFSTRDSHDRPGSIGEWMERLDWHRLPELLNVIKGDMALIGVKPLPPEELAHLTEEWQQRRSACKTGFTGLWYIQTVRTSQLDDVLVADAYYAATRDLRTDLGILRETPMAWFARARTKECSKGTAVPVQHQRAQRG